MLCFCVTMGLYFFTHPASARGQTLPSYVGYMEFLRSGCFVHKRLGGSVFFHSTLPLLRHQAASSDESKILFLCGVPKYWS